MAMLSGVERSNPGMNRWFEEELFPMMLEMESKVERLMTDNSTSSSRQRRTRANGRSRNQREKSMSKFGQHRQVVLRNSREDDRDLPRQPTYDRDPIRHFEDDRGSRQSSYDRDSLRQFEDDHCSSRQPEFSNTHRANGEVYDDYYDDKMVDDGRGDREAIEQLQHFLQESAAHQRHLAQVRQQRSETEAQYVPDTQGPVEIPIPSEAAPQSQPHKSRFEALMSLYGDSADSIVSMETNLQARFDRSVDANRPRYWPIIPLRF